MPSLNDFFTAVRDSNPFTANRVNEPSRYDIDVPAIHASSFDRLVHLADEAMRGRSGVGAVLLGNAGIGKSHLLSRLYRWAGEPTEDGGPRACYVFMHNILADPDRMPRYLLKYAVSRLSEGGQGTLHQTPLFRFVDRAIRHAMAAAKTRMDDPKEVLDAYRAYFGSLPGGRDVYEILFQFYRHARPAMANDRSRRYLASAAIAWLSGDEIDPEAAHNLGLKVNGQEPAMLKDDHHVEQVFLALTQLALVSGQPMILCVDQVDNLEAEKLKALTQFLHALIDHAGNLLVIVSGVKHSLLKCREEGIIPEAVWDRIAQYKVELNRVNQADARKILEARLERFVDPFTEVSDVRNHLREDTLFPLGRAWLETQLGNGMAFRPRDILTWARDAWIEEQATLKRLGGEKWLKGWPRAVTAPDPEVMEGKTGSKKVIVTVSREELEKVIDEAVDGKMKEQVAQHRLQAGSLPPDAGNLAGLVETLLGQCKGDGLPYTFRGVERMKKKGGRLPPYDLLVRERREPDGHEVTTGVLFVTNVGLSASAALRRLLEDEKPPDHRLLVTDHERRPLKVGPQGVEYYRDLEKLGADRFEHLKIDFDQYAGLDALSEVVGMAKSGDLEVEAPRGTIRAVSDAEVVASHHRKDRFRGHRLLRPLLTEEPPPKVVETKQVIKKFELDEKDVRQFVMAHLAWKMGSTAQAVAKGYVAAMPAPRVSHEVAWPQVKAIAERMHTEGLVHATPNDDDLFLLLKK